MNVYVGNFGDICRDRRPRLSEQHAKFVLHFLEVYTFADMILYEIFHFVTDSRGRLSLQWYKSNIRFSTVNSRLA